MAITTARQTELLDKLRERLQSIAIMAVQAQDKLGNPDAVFDALGDIESDLAAATKMNTVLSFGVEVK